MKTYLIEVNFKLTSENSCQNINFKHDVAVSANSEEEAFDLLNKAGIKFKPVESLTNGDIHDVNLKVRERLETRLNYVNWVLDNEKKEF